MPKFQRASARKHPPPPGTGTEPGGSSGLGAAPAPGTRQFTWVQMPGRPGPATDREKLKPTATNARSESLKSRATSARREDSESGIRRTRNASPDMFAAGRSPVRHLRWTAYPFSGLEVTCVSLLLRYVSEYRSNRGTCPISKPENGYAAHILGHVLKISQRRTCHGMRSWFGVQTHRAFKNSAIRTRPPWPWGQGSRCP